VEPLVMQETLGRQATLELEGEGAAEEEVFLGIFL